jgi:hypothetical protein
MAGAAQFSDRQQALGVRKALGELSAFFENFGQCSACGRETIVIQSVVGEALQTAFPCH